MHWKGKERGRYACSRPNRGQLCIGTNKQWPRRSTTNELLKRNGQNGPRARGRKTDFKNRGCRGGEPGVNLTNSEPCQGEKRRQNANKRSIKSWRPPTPERKGLLEQQEKLSGGRNAKTNLPSIGETLWRHQKMWGKTNQKGGKA